MPSTRYLAILALAVLLTGCVQGTPYRAERDPLPDRNGVIHEKKTIVIPAPKLGDEQECIAGRCINIVEFDEFGNAENRRQFNNGLLAAKTVAEQNGVVIVYIHGWHHNAKVGDKDITNFHKLLSKVKGKPVAGIYVGWRGESIDSNSIPGIVPSYGLTFWERKNTAHDIGNAGAVAELIRTLSDIRSRTDSRLLVIGHSFGGAMLYSAMSDAIAEQIRRDCQLNSGYTPIADMVVLVNPAVEAMRLRPLYSFARGFEYPDGQKPRLVILTTKADFPTRVLFRIGRHLGTAFHSYPNGAYKEQDVTAIGHYFPYITHQLKKQQCKAATKGIALKTSSADAKEEPKELCIAAKYKLTRCDESGDCDDVAPGHFITRSTAGEYIPKGFPIFNIRTTKDVIPNHTDIWGPPMQALMRAVLDEVDKVPPKSENKGLLPTECGTPTGEFISAI